MDAVELDVVVAQIGDHVVGHVVEGEILLESILDAFVQANEVLTHGSPSGGLPWFSKDAAEVK